MGDSACLVHSFSYASAFPNESIQANPMHALTESISFGRFMTEPLSWEKWSAFSSHQKYVEEAASYARKGSVAQKKAFFEAHYKRIAAQKAQQENEAEVGPDHDIGPKSVVFCSNVDVYEKMDGRKIEELKEDDGMVSKCDESVLVDGAEICEGKRNESLEKRPLKRNSIDKPENQNNGIPKIEKPLFEDSVANLEEIPSSASKKRSSFSSLRASIDLKTWKTPSTPLNQVTPQYNQEDNVPESTRTSSVETSDLSRNSANDCTTPIKTSVLEPVKSVSEHPAASPLPSENRRMKKANDPSGTESRTESRWHIFSAICTKSLNKLHLSTTSTPILRTEERATKRKQEKAGNGFRKLSWSLCFSARPSSHVYKDKDLPKIQTKKTAAVKPQSTILGRNNSNKNQGTISMPPPPPPPTSKVSKNLPKNNVLNSKKSIDTSSFETITHENKSPNILQ